MDAEGPHHPTLTGKMKKLLTETICKWIIWALGLISEELSTILRKLQLHT
jgi:hypothetical protein